MIIRVRTTLARLFFFSTRTNAEYVHDPDDHSKLRMREDVWITQALKKLQLAASNHGASSALICVMCVDIGFVRKQMSMKVYFK